MAAAARIGSTTDHPAGIVGGGPPLAPTVFIEGMPAAVRGDAHACATTTQGHLNTSVLVGGSGTVWIQGAAAARVGDRAACGATIMTGATTVQIGG